MQSHIEKYFLRNEILKAEGKDRLFYIIYLCSMSMLLSIIEYAVPKPFPWMKVGLANAITLYSFGLLKDKEILLLVVIRVFAVSLIIGTFLSTSFILSLTSAITSFFTMWLFYRLCRKILSLIGISIIGAVTSNVSQLFVVNKIFINSDISYYILPILILIALIGGTITGYFSEFLKRNI